MLMPRKYTFLYQNYENWLGMIFDQFYLKSFLAIFAKIQRKSYSKIRILPSPSPVAVPKRCKRDYELCRGRARKEDGPVPECILRVAHQAADRFYRLCGGLEVQDIKDQVGEARKHR